MKRIKKFTAILSVMLMLGATLYQVGAIGEYEEYPDNSIAASVEEVAVGSGEDHLLNVETGVASGSGEDGYPVGVIIPDQIDNNEPDVESGLLEYPFAEGEVSADGVFVMEDEGGFAGIAPMFGTPVELTVRARCYYTNAFLTLQPNIPVSWVFDPVDAFSVSFDLADAPTPPPGWSFAGIAMIRYQRSGPPDPVTGATIPLDPNPVESPLVQVGDRMVFNFPFAFTQGEFDAWHLNPVFYVIWRPVHPPIVKNATPVQTASLPVFVGDIVEYTITVTNPAVNPTVDLNWTFTTFDGFRVVDNLPRELSLIPGSVSVAGGTGVVNNSNAANNIIDVTFNLPGSNEPGSSVVITFRATVTAYALLVDQIINYAYLYKPHVDAPIRDREVVPVADPPSLVKNVISINNNAYTGQPVAEGDIVTYRLRVNNPNQRTINNFLVRDALPPGLTLIGVEQVIPATALVANQSTGNTVQVTLNLPSGNTDIIFTARVDDGTRAVAGKFVNVAHLYGPPDEGGQRPPLDRDDAEVKILPPDVTLVKSVSSGTVAPGGDLTYTIVVTNTGGIRLTNLVVTDDLPVQLANLRNLVISPAGAGTGRFEGQLLTVNIPSLAVRDSVTITFVVTVAEGVAYGSTIRNVARVTTDQNVRDEDDVTVNIPGGGGEDPPPPRPPGRAPETGDMGMNSPYLISFLISLLSIFAILSFESLKKGSKGKR